MGGAGGGEEEDEEEPDLEPAVDAFGDALPEGFGGGKDGKKGAAATGAEPLHVEPRGRHGLPDDPHLSEQWGDEQGFRREGQHSIMGEGGDGKGAATPAAAPSPDVWLDAHVLATPAAGDVDGDGHPDLVVPVSYFFDKAQYEGSHRAKEVEGLDLSKYVAGEF